MDGTRNERTIAAATAVEGIGYWSGRDVRSGVSACPAAVRDRLCSRRFARPAPHSRRDRQPLGKPAADGAPLGRGWRGHDRARHGGVGGLADRQLRDPRQPVGNARPRRLRASPSSAPCKKRGSSSKTPRGGRSGFAARSGWATREVGSKPARPPPAGRPSNTNWTTAAATRSGGNRWKSSFRRGSFL